MDYDRFIARVRQKKTNARSIYPQAMLQAAAKLVLEHGIAAKTVAQELLKESAWKNHSFQALHQAICRHVRKVRGLEPKSRRKPA